MRTSSRLSRASSACASRAVRYRLRATCAGLASSASRSPCAVISSRAPFSPIPGTPFTLSTASPMSASTSTTFPGATPNFSSTPAASSHVPSSRGLNTRTPSRTSWKKSLSPVTMPTSYPAARACSASVPITSSASNSSCVRIGTPSASHASCTAGTCTARSSGMEGRLALYSASRPVRNVGPRVSKAAATRSGCWSAMSLRSMATKPNTACVGLPSGPLSGRIAWYAR